MLTKLDYERIREELENCKKPLFFFDDDPDGLCSFLLLYRYIREGKGVVIKSTPNIDSKFLRKVEEYEPDKIFILDIAKIEPDFVDTVKVPIIHIDHHDVIKIRNVKHFNPRDKAPDDNIPTSVLCYNVVMRDLWILAVGMVSDWYIDEKLIEEFKREYPDLIDYDYKDPGDLLFETRLGKLIKIFSFNLKRSTNQAMSSVKVLTRINSPYEILDQTTSQGKYIFKKSESMNKEYDELIARGKECYDKDKNLFFFKYYSKNTSFTNDLANEFLHIYPDKLIIVAREKNGELKMSLRYKGNLAKIVEKALVGVEGFGGGHEHACGANIKSEDSKKFISTIEEEIN